MADENTQDGRQREGIFRFYATGKQFDAIVGALCDRGYMGNPNSAHLRGSVISETYVKPEGRKRIDFTGISDGNGAYEVEANVQALLPKDARHARQRLTEMIVQHTGVEPRHHETAVPVDTTSQTVQVGAVA